MTKDRVARAIELLERIAEHDHQGTAIRVLFAAPSSITEQQRMKLYAACLGSVANTDIQSWAKEAIRQLKGGDQ